MEPDDLADKLADSADAQVEAVELYRKQLWLNRLLVVLLVIAIGGMGYAIHRNAVAAGQLCTLNAKRLLDLEAQVVQTEGYLKSPVGLEKSGLNDYIRQVSFPRLQAQVKSDGRTFPSSCRDEYQALRE